MAAIITAGEAVARIAYLSSDSIISVQPSLSTESEFSPYLRRYAENNATSLVCKQTPEVSPVGRLQPGTGGKDHHRHNQQ